MKNKIRMIIMALLLCMSVLVPAVSINAADENTSSSINACKTVEYTDLEEVADYLAGKNTYPTEEGYLFAGWYTTDNIPEDETEALKYAIRSNVPEEGPVYALFVPASVLDVKAQLSAGLIGGLDGNSKGSIRFVTTVNSLLYKEVGFDVSYVNSKGAKKSATSSSNIVYEKLYAVGSTTEEYKEDGKEYLPTEFCAVSKYFKACNLNNVPASDFTVPFTIKPFWITIDGSKVYGETVIKSMDDYFLAEDVYVSTSDAVKDKADADGYGTSEGTPYVTLNYALSKVKNQGTIHIVDSYATTSDFVWEDHKKTVNITGGTIDFTTLPEVTLKEAVAETETTAAQAAKTAFALDMQDSVTFTNTTLVFTGTDTQHIYANGNTLEIASDVTWGNSDTSQAAYIRVYGGAHNVALASDTNLVLGAGQYSRIFGAGNYSELTGNVNITLSGSINPGLDYANHDGEYNVYGGGQNTASNVIGDVNINVTDATVLFHRVYGGGHNRSVEGDVNIKFAGMAMGVYGGGRGGTITGDTYLTMTGGWVEQLFGGCEDKSMTGNTNIDVQAGTVKRRIYGGCYNDTSGTSFATTECVDGHSNVSIGPKAEILLDYSDGDNSIYAISRGEAAFTDAEGKLIEKGAFIFNNELYESTYKSKLGYNAYIDLIGFSDDTHHYLITTNGNTEDGSLGTVSSQSDYIRIKPRRGYSALVEIEGSTQTYYTESEGVFKLPELTEKDAKQNITVTFNPIDESVDKTGYEARIDGAYYDTFVEAMAAAPVLDSKDTVTVTLLQNIEIAAQMSIESKIAIQNEPGTDITIYRGEGLAETDMFSVASTGTLTLAGVEDRESLVIDGRTEADADKSLDDVTGSTGSLIRNAGKLKLKNVTLQYAKNISDDAGASGALNSAGTSVEAENTIFANNNTSGYSGAIYIGKGKLALKNVDFIGNSGIYGGALRANTSTTVLIEKCTFGEENSGNIATTQGGAIYNYKADITIVDTDFEYNKAETGGAIYNNAGTIVVANSKFANNEAIKNGGAIHTNKDSSLTLTAKNANKHDSSAVFAGNKVTNGETKTNGGGAINMSNGSLAITGYRFEGNSSAKLGGAIRTATGSRIITGAIFTGNYTTGDGGNGGAIYMGGTGAEISDTKFEGNYTGGSAAHGGAIYLVSESTINVNVGIVNTFTDNTVKGTGSLGAHIYVPVTSSQLIESPESSIGTGKETDENMEYGQE